MKLRILQILLFLVSSTGYCCSCIDLTGISVLERINRTEQIFEGTVTEISSENEFMLNIEFTITRKIKGINSNNKISIQTAKSGSLCGDYFEKGQKLLIFSNANSTSICDGNIDLGNKTFNQFSISKIAKQHRFYFSKLKDFINEISKLKTASEFIEYDKDNNLIAKGRIGKNKIPIGEWIYKEVSTEEVIVEIKN